MSTQLSGAAALESVTTLVRSRRTSMIVDKERGVPEPLVARLCELATWAPNHKRTWPWRFALFSGDGRRRLGETMVADMNDAKGGDDVKREKTRTKYLRTPAILVVGSAAHTNELFDIENRDAVAAGIENLLLGATAAGLASFWSSPALTRPPGVLQLCGFEPDTQIVGVIYLGWATHDAPIPDRPHLVIKQVAS